MFDGFGSIAAAAIGYLGSERRNKAQAELASDQMEFQREMSNTAHQREVTDLKAAGLNPILSTKYGGSSTPPGAMAQLENAVGAGVNTGLAAALNKATIEKIKAETTNVAQDTEVKRATERQLDSGTMLNFANTIRSEQDTNTGSAQELNYNANTEVLKVDRAIRVETLPKVMAEVEQLGLKNDLTRGEIELMKQQIKNAIETNSQIKANTHNTRVNTILSELEIPLARNKARAEEHWFKQDYSPFLGDIQKFFNSGESLGRGARDLRNSIRR